MSFTLSNQALNSCYPNCPVELEYTWFCTCDLLTYILV